MKCINCGISISDIKRMCDECAAKMVSDLIEDKEKENAQDKKENILPADLPEGVVISWDPARKSGEVKPPKTSPKTG